MASYIVNQLIKNMVKKEITINKANILIMGFTFKENCNDIRNTMVSELALGLKEYNCNVDIYDPWIDISDIKKIYKYNFIAQVEKSKYDGIILAVAHDKFKDIGIKKIRRFGKSSTIVYDLKHMFNKDQSDLRL